MNKAAQLSKKLERLSVPEAMKLIEDANNGSLYFDVIDEAMCMMHDDGSVNIFESMGNGVVTGEVISAANILKVLKHYRPFKEVFKRNIQ
jgi:hypothetical protein